MPYAGGVAQVKRVRSFSVPCALLALLLMAPVAGAAEQERPAPTAGPASGEAAPSPVVSPGSGSSSAPTEAQKSDLCTLRPYKPLYGIFAHDRTLSRGESPYQDWEAQFQLSFQVPLANIPWASGKFAFGYTQVSFWQIFDTRSSAPFRDTNYAPEFMTTFEYQPDVFGLKKIFTRYSIIHQSNGRGGGESRSWNRLYAEVNLEWKHIFLGLKPWYRIPERQKSSPADARGDDNPDIARYLGYGELNAGYQNAGWSIQATVRNNLRGSGNQGSVQIEVTLPIKNDTKFYIQAFEGYGLSLLDYNRRSTRIGCGIMLAKWP